MKKELLLMLGVVLMVGLVGCTDENSSEMQTVNSEMMSEVTTEAEFQTEAESQTEAEFQIEATTVDGDETLAENETIGQSDGYIMESGATVSAPADAECITLSDEVNAEFLFSSNTNLRNLQIVSLSFDGIKYKQEEYVYNCYDFSEGEVLKVSCYLPDTYSSLLLQYEDSTGEFHRYFVTYDMGAAQPTVVLKDAMDADITLLE